MTDFRRNKVDEIPDWLFAETLEEATEAMIASATDPSDYNRGLRDATLEALKRVTRSDATPAHELVLARGFDILIDANRGDAGGHDE